MYYYVHSPCILLDYRCSGEEYRLISRKAAVNRAYLAFSF